MKNKKLLALFICLVCISVCIFLLTACGGNKNTETTTEPSESVSDTTEPETTVPPVEETTEEPTAEATEETTEEPTEPATQPANNSGGSTQVTTPQTTQPEEETQPEETIEVPAPGAENNAYVENFTSTIGQFTTVKIPAGEGIFYTLKTPGHFLRISHKDVWVIYGEKTYKPVDGLLEIPLPADGSKPMAMQFVNKGAEEQAFSVSILDAKGTASNPNPITSVKDMSVTLSKGNTDGIHYVWTADSDGLLRVGVASAKPKTVSVDVALTVNGTTVKLTDNAGDVVEIAVSKGDQVAIAVTAADGKAVEAVISGYVIPMVQLSVTKCPSSEASVSVPAQGTVIYQISGANGNVMRIKHSSVAVIYNGTVYEPDDNNFVKLILSDDVAQLEIYNTGNKANTYTFSFSYPLGHYQNPEKLTQIKENTVKAQLAGYWYIYTAEASGELIIGTETENVEIFLLNDRTQQYANLWYTNDSGEAVQGENVCVAVEAGDKIYIQILHANNIELQLSGRIASVESAAVEQLPYSLKTVKVAAGSYVFYEINGAADSVLTVTAKNVAVILDGVTYEPDDSGVVSVPVQADAVRIQLCNTGSKDTAYTMNFDHPAGSEEKPEELTKLEDVKVDLEKAVYYYTYTAKTNGLLSFSTDHTDTYIVLTNETTGETGSLWYTGDDGQVVKNDSVSVAVNKGDVITVQVVSAEAGVTQATITGLEETVAVLTVEQLPYKVKSVSVAAKGYVYYDISGVSGNVLTIQSKNVTVVYNGTTYEPDESNIVSLKLDAEPARIKLCNTGKTQTTYTMNFHYPVGHPENPENLTKLGDLDVAFESGSYYYTYTAQITGRIVFGTANKDTYIVLVNNTTEETAALWYTDPDGQVVKNETVGIDVKPGDAITVQVFAMDTGLTEAAISGREAYVHALTEDQLPVSYASVPVAAGNSLFYLVSGIDGNMLQITGQSMTVNYNGESCTPNESGAVELKLTGDKLVQISNTGDEEAVYTLRFDYALGHSRKPEALAALGQIDVVAENGSYSYSYTALADGKVIFSTESDDVDIILTNTTTEETAALWSTDENGQPVRSDYVGIAVLAGEQVHIQVVSKEDAAVQAQVTGVEAVALEMNNDQLPTVVDTANVAAGESVYYEISGICGNMLELEAVDTVIVMNGTAYEPDEAGHIQIKLGSVSDTAVLLQICNSSEQDRGYKLNFSFPVGHSKNPENLTELGEFTAVLEAGTDGYYYAYTAQKAGQLVLNLWESPEDTLTDVILTNSRTEESVSLWVEVDGEFVFNYSTAMLVLPGDVITVQTTVTALDDASVCIDGQAVLYGEFCGGEDSPIMVQFPGFTAQIPAGDTLYYQGYNLSELLLSVSGEATITYGGNTYEAVDGVASCMLLTSGRVPAVFAITNTGSKLASYEVEFLYPVGHSQNPDTLQLGTNTVNKVLAGMSDHIYTYVVPKDGTLKLTFDTAAQWVYAVDNVDQGIYGETCYSDDDPQVNETQIQVSEGDMLQLRVNTYDPENPGTNPAGSVSFTADLHTGPVEIADISVPYQLEMIAGETVTLTANVFGQQLKMVDAQNVTVICGGEIYAADESGTLQMTFPTNDSDAEALEFMVHNGGAADKTFTLLFGEQKGTSDNPDTFTIGTNVAVCEAGSDGYHYTFTAETAGKLKLALSEGYTWKIKYGTRTYTSDKTKSLSLSLTAGKTVEIIIFTYDPSNPDEVPAGSVEFTVTFG